jgi:hypothetical protein
VLDFSLQHFSKQKSSSKSGLRFQRTIFSSSNTITDITMSTPATNTESKAERIDRVKGNLPLPEDPPVASDWNSADARNVNVGSGGVSSDVSTGDGATTGLREPASQGSGVREEGGADLSGVGRQGKDGLEGLPKDAKAK